MARSEKITFTGADGESKLAARLDLPAAVGPTSTTVTSTVWRSVVIR